MITLRLFSLLISLTFAVPRLHAEDKFRISVQLKVSADDTIQGEVTSYLSREIRRLGDIDLVENEPSITISVIALVNKNRGDTTTGHTLSILAERPVRYRQMRQSLAKALSAEHVDSMLKVTDLVFDNTSRVLSHFVQVGPVDELENLCKKIVAQIDGTVFEGERKIYQRVLEMMMKNAQNPKK